MRTVTTVLAILASSLPLLSAAPQFLTDTIRSNCRSEVTTVFEETETESVNKVICQTEFRDECVKVVEPICRNVTVGEQECHNVDEFVCVDSMTNKCGIEKVLKNVSYTETVCDNKPQEICEYEIVGGVSRPVEGSCVTKTMEECQEVTRFEEEFVDEELCRDIPIKDCQNVEREVCKEKQNEVCESLETEKCEIVPHEECQQVVEIVPTKISKKVTRVVCDEDGEVGNEEAEEPQPDATNNIFNEIFEIFGVRNTNENEVEDDDQETTTEFMIDDGLFVETTPDTTTTRPTSTTTTSTTTTSTTTTSTTTTSSSTTTTTASTTTEAEGLLESSSQAVMDGSKIVFSDDEISARNKDLANRLYIGPSRLRPQTPSTEGTPRRKLDPNSRIFFPE